MKCNSFGIKMLLFLKTNEFAKPTLHFFGFNLTLSLAKTAEIGSKFKVNVPKMRES